MAIHLDDKRLVNQLLAGDEGAFGRFFEENFSRLYRFAAARLPDDPDAASDVAQVVLTKAIRALPRYRGESALYTWLCAICRNEIHDWLASRGRRREHVVLIEDEPAIRAAVESLGTPDTESPEANYRRRESLRLIQVALDQLPARYGDALEWKYVEGWTVSEIGEKLGIGTEATQSLLARAKRAFAAVYGPMAAGLEQQETGVSSA